DSSCGNGCPAGKMRQFGILLPISLILFLCAGQLLSSSDFRLIDTEPVWRRALGGEINAFAAQGPGGDVYIVADDRALHSLNPLTGKSNWIFRPGGRLRSLLMVAADGTIYVQNDRQELFAVTPGGTGRWKLRMGSEPSSLPAATPDGRVIIPLLGGRIVCVSRHGVILWTLDESAEASSAPVVSSRGLIWIPLTDGRIVVLDEWGEEIAHVSMRGIVSVLAMDSSSRIWAGGFDGSLAVFSEDDIDNLFSLNPDISLRAGSSRIAAILTDEQDNAQVFLADGDAVNYDNQGNEVSRKRIALSGGAPSATAEGVIFVPASDGSIRINYPEDNLESGDLRGNSVLAEPLLSDEGMLIAGGGDWILYAWEAGEPGEGWRQFRGSSRRSGTFPAEPVSMDRLEARHNPGFFYREMMAVSNDIAERIELLNELETYPDSRSMQRELPWVNLLLEDLVSVGTIRFVNQQNQSLQSHPTARGRAYLLLAGGDDFRSRSLILDCLEFEDDPVALAAGFRALGLIGSDWDGASMRLIARRYREQLPAEEQLTLETARALADLVRYNGDISDSSGNSLMTNLLSSRLSRLGREEVIAIIRNIAGL
ncbi:MAG: PQQ-binding-like beta-propeller repeat protein, partial [Spirochaetaceae bacterium]|nr:PQQ-binding-like beta-propeller repeat protein [Spirochaetaceae bacterium]